MFPFSRFEEICEQQGVVIDPVVVKAGTEHVTSKKHCHSLTTSMAAVAEAGNALRKNRDFRLTTRPVELPDNLAQDIGMRTLAGMANAAFYRPAATEPYPYDVSGENIPFLDCCYEAEEAFARSVVDDSGSFPTYSDVVLDSQGPLFIRKRHGMRSALSLRDGYVNGVPYPAGSIMQVQFEGETFDAIGPNMVGDWDMKQRFAIHRPSDIIGAAFLRLSTFALPSSERLRVTSLSDEELSDEVVDMIDFAMPRDIGTVLLQSIKKQLPAYAN